MEAVTAAVPPQLPARLLRFFAKYPPQLYGVKFTEQAIPLTKKDSKLLRMSQAEVKEQEKTLAEERRRDRAVAKKASEARLASIKAERAASSERIKAERAAERDKLKAIKDRIEAERAAERDKIRSINDRIEALNARQIRAPRVRPGVPMPAIMNPRYIPLGRLEKLEKLRLLQIHQEKEVERQVKAVERQVKAVERQVKAVERRSSRSPISMPAIFYPRYTSTKHLRSVSQSAPTTNFPANPFLPKRRNKQWLGAAIGLRRQAELVKLAKQHGVEALLPTSRKSTQFKQQRLLERGLRVKGTGVGQRVKGHKWERNYEAKMEERFKALQNMPALVRDWESRGHGRGLKRDQYPKVKLP